MNSRNHSQPNATPRFQEKYLKSDNPNLRVIMKSRNSHHTEVESSLGSNSKMSKYERIRLPTLPELSKLNYETISNDSDLLRRTNERRAQTLNCEEDLMVEKNWKYENIKTKLQELDEKIQSLIGKKLREISKKNRSISLCDKGQDELTDELQKLIQQIKKVKFEEDDKNQGMKELMDKKINLYEKLLAEKNAESDILKKYFFAVSAGNQKKKFSHSMNGGITFEKKVTSSRIDHSPCTPLRAPKESFCLQSSTKNSYRAPKQGEYETYRYKRKEYSENLQPLPRSSYNRQFLTYNCQPKDAPYKNIDNGPFFSTKMKQKMTNYSKDYTTLQAERINYKELDSYRNKIKDIQVSYTFNKKQMSPQLLDQHKQQIKEQVKQTMRQTNSQKKPNKINLQSSINPIISTESRRAYAGARGNSGIIKHKDLDRLKYAYKSMTYV